MIYAKISSVKIDGLEQGLVTDSSPNITFALASDKQGEELKSALISIGDWKRETTDQLNNIYDGPMEPFTEYTVHIVATEKAGKRHRLRQAFKPDVLIPHG